MVKKRRAWPEVGEYVVGTITRVEPHGAYAILDEYNNNEGMIHISEISSSWVRNIRNFVREKQKIVAKVLNVNPAKGHIDLSLRRVTKNTKKDKVKQWKRTQKAESLLEQSLEKYNQINQTSKTLDEVYNEIGWKMDDIFGDILSGFEAAKQKGPTVLTQKGIPAEWVQIFADIAEIHVEIPWVKILGIIEIQCYRPDGILQIQKALRSGVETIPANGTSVSINMIGSPKYRIEVISDNMKNAQAAIEKISQKIISIIQENNGQAKFSITE